jgi:hypothetical protein
LLISCFIDVFWIGLSWGVGVAGFLASR